MAIASVKQMVNDRLPYTTPTAFDVVIERTRVQMTYLLQEQTEKSNADVEAEANYTALQNMLFAAMVSFQMVKSKVMLTMAGDGTTGPQNKILKKAKADVVEAEFMTVKSADGSLIQMETTKFLEILLQEVCSLSGQLNYYLAWCGQELDVIPAFIVGDDYPPQTIDWDEALFGGQPIGGT